MVKTKVFEQNIGGAEFNVAAGVSQLGSKTGVITKIPDNDIGRLVENEIHYQNVFSVFVVKDKDDFGSVIYDVKKDIFVEEKMYENIEVIDRIGSGDAYIAGVLYGVLKNPDDIEKALKYGNAVSSLKNTMLGDLAVMKIGEAEDIIKKYNNSKQGLKMQRYYIKAVTLVTAFFYELNWAYFLGEIPTACKGF